MEIHRLEKKYLQSCESSAKHIRLLCQIPLNDDDYKDLKNSLQAFFSSPDSIIFLASECPFLFSWFVCGVAFREFCPKGSNEGEQWLWSNFSSAISNCISTPGTLIGINFKNALTKLKEKHFSSLVCPDETKFGWSKAGPILIHAGIPLRSVVDILNAFSKNIDNVDSILKLSKEQITSILEQASHVNKYTYKALLETKSIGHKIIRSLLNLFVFFRDGRDIDSADYKLLGFSDSLINEVKTYCTSNKKNIDTKESQCQKSAKIIWDIVICKINLVTLKSVTCNGQQITDWIFTKSRQREDYKASKDKVHTLTKINIDDPKLLVNHKVLPKVNSVLIKTEELITPFRLYKRLPHFLLFHPKTGRYLSEADLSKGLKKEYDYPCLVHRNSDLSVCIPDRENILKVIEEDLNLPYLWRNIYKAFRVRFIKSDTFALHMFPTKCPISIEVFDEKSTLGMEFTGEKLFLSSFHESLLGEKIHVYGGEVPPSILILNSNYDEKFHPILSCLIWKGNSWNILPSPFLWNEHQFGIRASFNSKLVKKWCNTNLPLFFKIEHHDFKIDGAQFEEYYFLWIPNAKTKLMCGLVSHDNTPKLELTLPKINLLNIGIHHDHTDNAYFISEHEQETTDRTVYFEHCWRLNDGSKQTILFEWINYSRLFITAPKECENLKINTPFINSPLPSMDISELDDWGNKMIALNWWPLLKAQSLICGTPIVLHDFDSHGDEKLMLSQVTVNKLSKSTFSNILLNIVPLLSINLNITIIQIINNQILKNANHVHISELLKEVNIRQFITCIKRYLRQVEISVYLARKNALLMNESITNINSIQQHHPIFKFNGVRLSLDLINEYLQTLSISENYNVMLQKEIHSLLLLTQRLISLERQFKKL